MVSGKSQLLVWGAPISTHLSGAVIVQEVFQPKLDRMMRDIVWIMDNPGNRTLSYFAPAGSCGRVRQEFPLLLGRINFMPRSINGEPCSSRSKMSTGLTSVPEDNIFSFSQTWGSGENGASPRVRQSTTIMESGIESRRFTATSDRDKQPVSCFLQLRQQFEMPLFLGDNMLYLPAGILVIEHSFDKLVKKDRILFERF